MGRDIRITRLRTTGQRLEIAVLFAFDSVAESHMVLALPNPKKKVSRLLTTTVTWWHDSARCSDMVR